LLILLSLLVRVPAVSESRAAGGHQRRRLRRKCRLQFTFDCDTEGLMLSRRNAS